MSQIEYRKRLRANQQTAAAKPVVEKPTEQLPQAELQVDNSHVVTAVVVPQVEPVQDQPIVPVSVDTTKGMTPQQLREHAKRTAELLANLDQQPYNETLRAMEASNPVLYGVVVDELNNIAAEAAQADLLYSGGDVAEDGGASKNS